MPLIDNEQIIETAAGATIYVFQCEEVVGLTIKGNVEVHLTVEETLRLGVALLKGIDQVTKWAAEQSVPYMPMENTDPSFGARSGRLSCAKPNLSQVPRKEGE